mmetsp:Transcript_129928/g.277437  ORF Transcript_129928/g.277437 Transcript_129928/m.277437 type:complete len:576 (+) Transcript_129928:93-1820(+)
MGMLEGFSVRDAVDSVLQVYAPKYVIISNNRLGLLFRLLQIAAVMWVLWTASTADPAPWHQVSVPIGYGFSCWADPADQESLNNFNVAHCNDLNLFEYFWSASWVYRPSQCKILPGTRAFRRRPGGLFIPTLIQEGYLWEGSGSDCGNSTRDSCEQKTGGQYSASGQSCTCTRNTEFFTKSPEDLMVSFLHGYEVERRSLQNTPSTNRVQSGIPDHNLLTAIKGPDGEDCVIDNFHRWSPQASSQGISGKLSEWLACGKVNLDERRQELRSFNTGETEAPHVRITGVKLIIDLHYTNPYRGDYWNGPGADAKVTAVPQWNAWNDVVYTQLPGDAGNGTASVSSYTYGVSVELAAHGEIGDVSVYRILDMIVSIVVIVSAPASIIYYIILYGVGKLSQIYYKAACEEMDIKKDFPGIICRMMGAASNFRVLSGQSHTASQDLQPMSNADIDNRVKECLGSHYTEGALDDHEIDIITSTTARVLRHQKAGEINLESFVDVAMRNETMSVEEVVNFFDKDRRRGILEVIFDDSRKIRRRSGVPSADARKDDSQRSSGQPESSGIPMEQPAMTVGLDRM